ncbi:hypothetical protein PGT21_000800, partial [Puccinia graminis f. sp. tritici]
MVQTETQFPLLRPLKRRADFCATPAANKDTIHPRCPTKSNKKQGKASANAAEARTGATSVVTYGNYESQEEDDSFDEEIDVWG